MADTVISHSTVVNMARQQPESFPYKVEWANAGNLCGGWFIFWSSETTQENSKRVDYPSPSAPMLPVPYSGPYPELGVQGFAVNLIDQRRAKLGLEPTEPYVWTLTALDKAEYLAGNITPLQLDPP